MPKQLSYTDSSDFNSDDDEVRTEDEGSLAELRQKSSSIASFKVILWSGINKKTPILNFTPHALLIGLQPEGREQIAKYHLAFKFVKTECKLVRNLLSVHGFREVHPNSSDFNLMWTGSHLKPYTLRGMLEFQKINHFPRSYELTRKDRLYKNIQRMQHSKGRKHFDFIPDSYVLPGELSEFYAHFVRDKGPWIVKPVALSRGRGIFLVNHPSQVPLEENLLVCKYINNPLLIDGFKLDLRLYIAVTSFDPLRIYLYEEGLTRFATVKYDKSGKYIRNSCMHLTNYSVNKKSADFVSEECAIFIHLPIAKTLLRYFFSPIFLRCLDPEVEDYGTKWSMSATLRYLKRTGRDTTSLMLRIEDLVIKTIIAGELPIASASKMFMPHPGNCFEIFGFDVLVDENLRPWLLEVNLSPSLACDSPLDLKIKSHLVSDMLNIAGFIAHDPLVRKLPSRRSQMDLTQNKVPAYRRQRAQSAGAVRLTGSCRGTGVGKKVNQEDSLTAEEMKVLRTTKEEYNRRGGFVRIFPSPTSWELYGSFLEHRTTHNQMLHARLFPDSKSTNQRPTTASYSSATARARNLTRYNGETTDPCQPFEAKQMSSSTKNGLDLAERMTRYERKLDSWSPSPSKSSLSLQSGVITPETPSMGSVLHETKSRPKTNADTRVTTVGSRDKFDSEKFSSGVSGANRNDASSARQSILEVRVPSVSHEISSAHRDHEKESAKKHSNLTPNGVAHSHSAKPLSAQLLHKYNSVKVDDIMSKAGTLKKLQARQAFAMYLQRVQQRLIHETSYDTDDSCRDETDILSQDEQMSLIIRFLKRAASNLQQPFKVVVPSQKLPLRDRQRILAKELGDFVHVYGKETAQLQRRQEIYRIYRVGRESDIEIPEEDFKVFMATASETELEDLLTQYTKLNKNSNVFLGGKAESVKSDNAASSEEIRTSLMRKRGSIDHVRTNKSTSYEGGWTKSGVEDFSSTESVNADKKEKQNRAVTAVSAYGSSVALNRQRQRPASARVASTQQGERVSRSARPISAKVSREKSVGMDAALSTRVNLQRSSTPGARQEKFGVGETKGYKLSDEHAVTVALERLAKRQAARQYSAVNNSNTNGQKWAELFSKMDFSKDTVDCNQKDEDFVNVSNTRPEPEKSQRHSKQDRHLSANSTFDNFIGYEKRPSGDGASDSQFPVEQHISSREVTHSSRHNAIPQSPKWKSLVHVDLKGRFSAAQDENSKIEKKSEESKEREKSGGRDREEYNKHIRMISQKLAQQQQQRPQHSTLPHPPPKPSGTRKPMSAQRIARLAAAAGISNGDSKSTGNYYTNGFA